MPTPASALGLAVLMTVLLGACSAEPKPPPTPTAEDRARLAIVDHFRAELPPGVWLEVESQGWYDGGMMSEEGLRLLDLLTGYFRDTRPDEQLDVLKHYPRGIDARTADALEDLNEAVAIPRLMLEPWFRDGIDLNERTLVDLSVAVLPDVEYAQALLDVADADWFQDGLDERENAVINATAALGPEGREAALRVLDGLDDGLFDYVRFDLPLSGEIFLLVTAESKEVRDRASPALDLVRRSMSQVESFAGRYRSRYIVVSVFGDLGRACGIAQILDTAPGIVSLNLPCLQEQTVVHELAHVFIGGGPTWFAEGIADLVYYHLRRGIGAYLSLSVNGRARGQIDGNRRLQLGSEEYANQGALGAGFLVEAYQVMGAQSMAAAVQEIAALGPRRDGGEILQTLLKHAPEDRKASVTALVTKWFRLG